jgi:hypothetical protein
MSLKAALAYLVGSLLAVAVAGLLTPPSSSDPWVVMRLLYYVALMSLFFFLPAVLAGLASRKPLRTGYVVAAAIGGGLLAVSLHAWLFNPSCRHSALWEPMCFQGVAAAMKPDADGVAVVLVAHAMGIAAWLASLSWFNRSNRP